MLPQNISMCIMNPRKLISVVCGFEQLNKVKHVRLIRSQKKEKSVMISVCVGNKHEQHSKA